MYCDSLAGLLLAVKHWPAERLNFIVGGGREEGGGKKYRWEKENGHPGPVSRIHASGRRGRGGRGVSLGLNCCRGCVYVAPRVFDGDRDKEWKRGKSGVYGLRSLRAKVVAISGYNFSSINTVSMYLWRYLFRDRFQGISSEWYFRDGNLKLGLYTKVKIGIDENYF